MSVAVFRNVFSPGRQWEGCWHWFFPVWPPSVNHTWRNGGGGTHLDPKVRDFRSAMQGEMMIARSKHAMPKQALAGDLALEIVFYPPTAQKRDLDNLAKCPLDAFTHCGLWLDDSQVKDLHTSLGGSVPGGGFWARLRPLGE